MTTSSELASWLSIEPMWCSLVFLPFGKIPSGKILANFQSKQRFLTSWTNLCQKSCDLKLELVTILYGWFVDNKIKKQNTRDQVMFFFLKKWIYTPLFLTPYPILELAWPFWTGIIDISCRWCKLNFGPLRETRLNHYFI